MEWEAHEPLGPLDHPRNLCTLEMKQGSFLHTLALQHRMVQRRPVPEAPSLEWALRLERPRTLLLLTAHQELYSYYQNEALHQMLPPRAAVRAQGLLLP